jgi:hypothetical protein
MTIPRLFPEKKPGTDTRELTRDEVQDRFLTYVATMVHYWDTNASTKNMTAREKMEGVVHSILATLDGCSMGLPGFIVAPCPHESDRQFHIDEGDEYYFPENHESNVQCDIAGGLHELIYQYHRKYHD